jgi:signal transduction histidine kinase
MRRYLARVRLHRKRPSIRLRLAVTYAGLFLVTCTALLAINYGLLYRDLYTGLSLSPVAAKGAGQEHLRQRDTQPAAPAAQGSADQAARELAERARLTDQTLRHAAETSAIALAVTAALVLAASWIVAGRMLRPLQTLTATTRRISQDRLHERIALTGPHDELKELADTFDEMVARLEASFSSQRRFVADASHELRTPLAIVRTSAEVLMAKRQSTITQWEAMANRVLTATGRAERLLDGLLALAASDSGVIAQEPHDLAVAAAVALNETNREAENADLTITTDLRPTPVSGDPVLLDRLVTNLVENAIRHNRHGGWIDVTTNHRDGVAVISVRNSGATIRPQDVDRMFEPFQRLESNRAAGAKSTGLGLAIVKSIAGAHLGTVQAAPIADGGLAVIVTLPTREKPPAGPTAHGETVLDVPSTATARVRELSRGGRRKNDVIDAAEAASVAGLRADATPAPAEDLSTVLSLLEERRANLTAARTRAVNQLHALLRDLVPGGAPTELSAAAAAGLLARVRPASPMERARKQLARDLILEIRGVDARMAAIAKRMSGHPR